MKTTTAMMTRRSEDLYISRCLFYITCLGTELRHARTKPLEGLLYWRQANQLSNFRKVLAHSVSPAPSLAVCEQGTLTPAGFRSRFLLAQAPPLWRVMTPSVRGFLFRRMYNVVEI